MPVHVERAELPGIGIRTDLVTKEGRRLSVVSLRDGRREVALSDEDDPDRADETIVLTDDEANAVSEMLGGAHIITQLAGVQEVPGLHMEKIPLRADSPYVGRALGDTKARTLTRCSIVAIVRATEVVPAPEPGDLLEAGDALVAVGTREGLDRLVRIVSGD